MRTLVVYYSRSGTTKKIAEAISSIMGSDREQIIDLRKRAGFFGYMSSGYSAVTMRLTEIKKTELDPSAYGLMVIGTPVWAGNMTPAIRTFITHLNAEGSLESKRVAFFCTNNGSGHDKTLRSMASLMGAEPIATIHLRRAEVESGDYETRIREFVTQLS